MKTLFAIVALCFVAVMDLAAQPCYFSAPATAAPNPCTNVGIGTASPTSIQSNGPVLHLFGSGPSLRIQDTASGGDWNLFARNGGSTNLFRIYDNAHNADRLSIDGAGNVGIGTTGPVSMLDVSDGTRHTWLQPRTSESGTGLKAGIDLASYGGYKLNLAGDIAAGGTSGGVSLSYYNASTGVWNSAVDIKNAAGMGNLLLMQDGGSVGIGTASPGYKVDVKTGTSEHFALTSASGGFPFSGPLLDAVDDSNNLLPMVYNASKHVFYNGSVGIGQMVPSAKLEVFGPSDAAFTGTSNSLLYLNSDDTNNNWRGVTFGRGGYALGKIGIQRTSSGSYMAFGTSNNYGAGVTKQAMTIDPAGNVGIGTSAPSVALDVVGNIHASGGIYADGTVRATFQDLAEWVPSSGEIAAGTVVIVSESVGNTVVPSSNAYDTRVAGVVSPTPGLLLGVESPYKSKIATTGRVKVRVDASRAPIHLGDLLVTSDIPGTAMKSEPLDIGGVKIHRPGTLIGKALEPLAKGQGEILVLLSLQ